MKRLVLAYLAPLAFATAVLVLVLFGWTVYSIDDQSRKSSRLVAHTLDAIRGIDEIDTGISRAEAAQRGYLLSDLDGFATERAQALAKVRISVANLELLLSDNGIQVQRLLQIDGLIGQRVKLMQEGLNVVRDSRLTLDGVARFQQAESVRQVAQLRLDALLDDMKQEELRLLGLRRESEFARYQTQFVVLSIALLISLAILLPGCIGFAFQARERDRAERKLSTMADDLPGAVYQCRSIRKDSLPGCFTFVSSSVQKLLGLERRQLLADLSIFWTCVLPEDRPGFQSALEHCLKSLEPLHYEFRVQHPLKGLVWIRSTASIRKEPEGALLWNGYWEDITERKRLEQVEHEAKADARYRGLLEAAPDAMVVVNPAGEIVIQNMQAEKQFGYGRDELLGQPVTRIIPDGFAERLIADGTRSAADALMQQIGTGIELSGQRRDGSRFPIEIMLSPLQSSDGILVTAAIRDISVRKQGELQQAAAEASNRAKSVFLATMSHEIRTPMNGLLGMLELLSLTKLDPEQLATLDVMRDSGKSLQRVLDDILDFSKMEAGKLDVRPESSSISRIVESVHNLYAGNASNRGLLLTYKFDPAISPVLVVDPMRLRQILNNLVSNAIKFTLKGSIKLAVELLERRTGTDRLRFTVTDTGIGISQTNQARLFQPFVQVASDAPSTFGGTGLGLTICQRLAGMMGGTITMQSTPGVGTTMVLDLVLPIAEPASIPKAEPQSTRDWLSTNSSMRRLAPPYINARAEGTLVLIAEDHPTNRALLMRQVNLLGYAAESAENGVQALAMWRSGRYSLVITDGNMPEMDGYELARNIRKDELLAGNHGRTPIVACTANVLGQESAICLAAGMDDYLAKPVELKDLAERLDRWLPIPRPAAPALDRSVLQVISLGEASAERAILDDFRRINDADAATLEVAVDSSDMPDVMRALHRIKGACRMVGAKALSDVCEDLESAGNANDWGRIEAHMEILQYELERLNSYIKDL